MRKLKFMLGISLLLFTLMSGCAGETTTAVSPVTFSQLTSEPDKYNNKVISIQGFWFDGFEIVVLAERPEPASYPVGNVQPAGTKIWVQGGLPEEVRRELVLQPDNPTGYPAHYRKVELTGTLEYGSKYGHMDAYQYRLTIQSAKTLLMN
jgi:hypothetical protein